MAALAAAWLVSACATGPAVVKIGHVAPLTGSIGHLGADNERGALLAIEELNAQRPQIGGQPVVFELVRENDEAMPRQGVAAAQRLVQARVSGVVGHLNSGTTIPASRVYADAGIPMITPSATNPKLTRQGFKTVFRLIADDIHAAAVMGRLAVAEFSARRIAVVDDRTAYGQGVGDAFEQAAKAAGGTIVTREFTRTDTTDFAGVAAALLDAKPDLVFYGGMDTQAGPLLKQLRDKGLDARFLGADGICSGELSRLSSHTLGNDKVFCSEPGGTPAESATRLAGFKERFNRRFGNQPVIYAPNSYDAVRILAAAMTTAGSPDPKVYLPVLARSPYPEGVTGPVAFDDKGDLQQATITLFTYRDGKRAEVGVRR